MADNKAITDGAGASFQGAADELSDGAFAPKVQLLDGTTSPTPLATGAVLGALTEVAPATDTASSGLNGRLQRIAQRITSLIALVPASLGPKAKASALSVTETDQYDEYETVAASQTAQVLGATGAVGDYLAGLLVVPASTSPGVVTILDNAISINVFAGGAGSITTLHPFFIPIGLTSVSGAWKVTTGANLSVIAIGNFT